MGALAQYDPMYRDTVLQQLEQEEDSFGSGIFDQTGRDATSNADLGVFASNYSLPGYIAREVPFTVSREIQDITDDAAVVTVPGGGLTYIERGGKAAGAKIQPAGPTRHDQVYAYLAGQPRRPVRARQRVPAQVNMVRMTPAQNADIPYASIFMASQTPVAVGPTGYPVAQAAPGMPSGREIAFTPTFNVGDTRPLAIRGYGQEAEPKSTSTPTWQLAAAGAMVGAACALLWEVVR